MVHMSCVSVDHMSCFSVIIIIIIIIILRQKTQGVSWYLKYLLHLFRRVAAFVELILFSSSVSLQIWYFDPPNVLVAD